VNLPINFPDDNVDNLIIEYAPKNTKKTFEIIKTFYDNGVNVDKLSSIIILSKFIFEYLKHVKEFLDDPNNLEDNHNLVSWLDREGLPKLEGITDNISIKGKEELFDLGIIEDMMIKALKNDENISNNLYLYDIIYQFEDRLIENNFLGTTSVHFQSSEHFFYGDGIEVVKSVNLSLEYVKGQ
jgi:hypothetical protein